MTVIDPTRVRGSACVDCAMTLVRMILRGCPRTWCPHMAFRLPGEGA